MQFVEVPRARRATLALVASAALGCGEGSPASPHMDGPGASPGPAAILNSTVDADGGGVLPGADGGSAVPGMGLPCDVASILQSKCVACHSSPPAGGAPMPLETYADLTAPAKTNPGVTVAALSITRMQSATMPMPPAGNSPPTAQDIATLQGWVSAGEPQGACGGIDAGAVASPYATPLQCSSGTMWTAGTDGNPRMKPGGACISCHSSSGGEAPTFSIAGTVYKTAHEPDDCNGAGASGATVVITDANGGVLTLTVNSAGNFYSNQRVATPFHAKVVSGGAERAMSAAQTSGDCNLCHTVNGSSSAPGRIMLP
ncbi:MAG TPA: hypothetical protein VKU41_11070 [Polyangiaceae bacterium]|nr:hypothetical protein [Polyangiaceae bacterium]